MASVINYSTIPQGARKISDHVNARAGVTASEQITVPEGATMVLLSADGPFFVAFGANPTATVNADTDDGSANELINPASPAESRMFTVTDVDKIAVAAATSTSITAAFFQH